MRSCRGTLRSSGPPRRLSRWATRGGAAGPGSGVSRRDAARWSPAPGPRMAPVARTSSGSIAGWPKPGTWVSSRSRSRRWTDGRSRSMRACSGRSAPGTRGGPTPSRPPPRPRLRAGLTALAAFHQVLARHQVRGPSPGLQARFHELNWLTLGGFDVLEGAIDRAPAESGRAPARRWLDLARRAAPRVIPPLRRASARVVALQPCLRDARPEHLLFTGERVTGLVDFGAMAIESVAADLARLLAEWVGADRSARADALDAYSAVRSPGRRRVGPAQGLRRLGRPARRGPLGPLALRRGTRLPRSRGRPPGPGTRRRSGRPIVETRSVGPRSAVAGTLGELAAWVASARVWLRSRHASQRWRPGLVRRRS